MKTTPLLCSSPLSARLRQSFVLWSNETGTEKRRKFQSHSWKIKNRHNCAEELTLLKTFWTCSCAERQFQINVKEQTNFLEYFAAQLLLQHRRVTLLTSKVTSLLLGNPRVSVVLTASHTSHHHTLYAYHYTAGRVEATRCPSCFLSLIMWTSTSVFSITVLTVNSRGWWEM